MLYKRVAEELIGRLEKLAFFLLLWESLVCEEASAFGEQRDLFISHFLTVVMIFLSRGFFMPFEGGARVCNGSSLNPPSLTFSL